ncbi:MAG: DUF1636 domain-containing protein [Pseudomonadota bacterium]
MSKADPVLSICMTCRDGRESEAGTRGGARLARRIAARQMERGGPEMQIRGVHCMSQCKRPCIVSLTAEERFTYIFGDLDPNSERDVEALVDLVSLYSEATEGFLERKERPTELQANILGRLPPLGSQSSLISDLELVKT